VFQLFKFTSYTLGYVVLDNRPAIEHTKHSCADHSNPIWSHLKLWFGHLKSKRQYWQIWPSASAGTLDCHV